MSDDGSHALTKWFRVACLAAFIIVLFVALVTMVGAAWPR
jgi:hypothetical protein